MAQINKLRKANQIPFRVVSWLEQLTPVVLDDEFGTMYEGRIIAEDHYGRYAATVGVTDQLMVSPVTTCSRTPFRILKMEQGILVFEKKGGQRHTMLNSSDES
ncbi:MAG: hypothetical protein P4N59_14860 [Negativicutes bacterium]|nr:hypothetical protein [Negativicutes bacterium]